MEDEEVRPARINWADVAYSFFCPVKGLFEGLAEGVQVLQTSLALHSEHIAERQAFKKDAGRFIESLATEDK